MAKMKTATSDFTIHEPEPIASVNLADKNKQVLVRVENVDGVTRTFVATMTGINFSANAGAGTALGHEGTSEFYSACVTVVNVRDAATGNPNNTVTVVGTKSDGTTSQHSVDFEAVKGGSDCHAAGTKAAGSLYAATRPAALARAGNPVPVALSLQVEAPVGTADPDAAHLNRPTTLRFSNSSADECCWLSQPVDAHSDQSSPAFWMLRTGDARTWVLILRRGDSDVAIYHLTAPAVKGTPFPLRMRLAGGGAWPQTVTVSPAP